MCRAFFLSAARLCWGLIVRVCWVIAAKAELPILFVFS